MTAPKHTAIEDLPEWNVAMERYTASYDPETAEKMITELTQSITTYLQQEIDKAVIDEIEQFEYLDFGDDMNPITDLIVENYVKKRIATIRERKQNE